MLSGFGFAGIGVIRAVDAGTSGEGVDFEPGIVRKACQPGHGGVGEGLDCGVLFECASVFGRFIETAAEVCESQDFDFKTGEQGAQLGDLARILCCNHDCAHGLGPICMTIL